MKRTLELTMIVLALSALIASCKKATSTIPICQNEISSISIGFTQGSTHSTNNQTFQYDNNGRSINTVYSNDSIIAYGGIYVYLLDTNGRPARENVIDGSHYTFSYQPDGYLAQSLFFPMGSSSAALTNTYTWQGDNLIQMSSLNGNFPYPTIYSYTYYSQPYQQLDPNYIPLGHQTAYLVKEQTSTYNGLPVAGDTTIYTYQFDTKGRVSSYIKAIGDTTTYSYTLTYKCN